MAVLSAMVDQGVIPVFYHPDAEVCKKVIQACANGGAKCIEFTNRGDFASHVFLDVARHFAKADPSVIMGVGSVVDAPTAGIYIGNGAKFVVGPLLNADVAKVCNRRKIAYSPGCGSMSEISYAEELGCEIVKIFPGDSVGGPEFVKSVLAPCPWTRIMPTGGVDCTEDFAEKVVQCRRRLRRHGLQADHQTTSRPPGLCRYREEGPRHHSVDQDHSREVSNERDLENPTGQRDQMGLRCIRRGHAAI